VARRVAREEEASPSGLKRPGILPWVILIVVAIVALWPMYWLYITAFTPTLDTVKTPPDLIPIHASLSNFSRLFQQAKDYWRWALNSLIISLSVTAFHLLFDTMAGYAFAKKRFPGRNFFFWLILSTLMIPSHVTLVPLYIVARHLHLINNILAVILPGTADVFGIFLMRQYIQTLPSELEEAARMDGCTEPGVFWRVIVPLSKPALGALAIFSFVRYWNDLAADCPAKEPALHAAGRRRQPARGISHRLRPDLRGRGARRPADDRFLPDLPALLHRGRADGRGERVRK
jgi:multiple sugar transport system permease protein